MLKAATAQRERTSLFAQPVNHVWITFSSHKFKDQIRLHRSGKLLWTFYQWALTYKECCTFCCITCIVVHTVLSSRQHPSRLLCFTSVCSTSRWPSLPLAHHMIWPRHFLNAASIPTVCDYCSTGDLYTYWQMIGQFTENAVRVFAAELGSALGEYERTVKPTYILCTFLLKYPS